MVPTAIAGTERVRNWKRLQFPKVTVQFGEPLRFEQVDEPTKEQAQAASEVVFDRVRDLTRAWSARAARARSAAPATPAAPRAAAEAAGRRPVDA